MLHVTLISHTPDPEKTIAAAAKLCYSPAAISDLMEHLEQETADNFVRMLADIGHESPIEHVNFTFGIEGVSRALLAQITRHRIASYSVQSQRYVTQLDFEYVTPPEIEALPEAKAEFTRAMEAAAAAYGRLTATLRQQHKQRLMEQGVAEKTAERQAEKLAIEDARFVLPNACTTKMIVTMNARSLFNFFRHRCCNRAQWEIRQLAEEMLALVQGVAPTLFAGIGPPCLTKACPEGKMSCGKQSEVRRRYASRRMEDNQDG